MVAPLVHAEHRIARRLRDAGACSPETAQPVVPKRLFDHRAVSRMVGAGALRDVGGQRYYPRPRRLQRASQPRAKRALMIIALILFVMLLLALAGVISAPPPPP